MDKVRRGFTVKSNRAVFRRALALRYSCTTDLIKEFCASPQKFQGRGFEAGTEKKRSLYILFGPLKYC